MQQYNGLAASTYTSHVKHELNILIKHLREDVHTLKDPSAQALFETSADVLGGLEKAFVDFERRSSSRK